MTGKKLSFSFTYLLLILFASVFVSRPTGLKTNNVTFTSVRLDWNPVPERFILGYRILVQNIPLNATIPWNKTSALITGLCSNTRYTISVLPVHGLTDEEYLVGSAASIIVTTLREPGKKYFRVSNSYNESKFLHEIRISDCLNHN